MRILFLGGTGLTGPYAVRRLDGLGHDVTVFHRGDHEAELPEGVRHVHGHFAHPPREILYARFDAVVHMRAMTSDDAERFIEAFRPVAGRVVLVSSGDVYRAYGRFLRLESGPPDPKPLTEGAPLRESRYPYRDAAPDKEHWMARYDKILVEQVVMNQAYVPWSIPRFPAVAGPGEYGRFSKWLQPMLRGDRELRVQAGWADWRWTHGFAEDVAEAVVLAALDPSAKNRIYNVGESSTPTMMERLAAFARAADWRGEIMAVPAAELDEANRMPYDFDHHLVYDTSRIRNELGYREVVGYEQSLSRMIETEREALHTQ